MNHRLRPLLALLAVTATATASADIITRYEFLSGTGPSTVASGIAATAFEPGASIVSGSLSGDGQPAPSWQGTHWTTSSDPSDALLSDSYVWFRITQDIGKAMTLTGIQLDVRPHGSGPDSFVVSVVEVSTGLGSQLGAPLLHSDQRTIADGFKAWETLSATSNAFQSLTGTYEIRIYGYDAKQVEREVLFDNVTIVGTVFAVPEPSTTLLLALSGGWLWWRRRPLARP